MKKLILASVAGFGMLTMAACSDSGKDATTTQSTTPQPEQTTPAAPMKPDATAPAMKPTPDSGTGGETQSGGGAMKPVEPAPAQ